MYRIGISGCGKIAQVRHIPEYEANADAELAAFYDINHERAEDIAAKHGGCPTDCARNKKPEN